MNMEKLELQSLNTIYKIGDKPKYIYFIKSGIVEVFLLIFIYLIVHEKAESFENY